MEINKLILKLYGHTSNNQVKLQEDEQTWQTTFSDTKIYCKTTVTKIAVSTNIDTEICEIEYRVQKMHTQFITEVQ